MNYTPINAVTRKPYNGSNIEALTRAAHALGVLNGPRWMTFLQAKGLGLKVKKGEHGTRIEFWKSETRAESGQGDEQTPKERLVRKIYMVFHSSQIEGVEGLSEV